MVFGAIYGDIIGSYYEVHCTKDYSFEFQRDSTFTDDSVMTARLFCKIHSQSQDMKSKNGHLSMQFSISSIIPTFRMQATAICFASGQRIVKI